MDDLLTTRFEDDRARLHAVAFRMLGSTSEAEDAVQETWMRLQRTDTTEVGNLAGWLTTVIGRVCLDMLRSRTARREEPLEAGPTDPPARLAAGDDPERDALLADAVGPALLTVLDTLGPAERLAFVLHDLFAVPFDEIAVILGRTPATARQLASRGRRRVQGGSPGDTDADPARRRRVVEAFLAASREGDFAGLLAVLDPDVVLRADQVAVDAAAASQAAGAPGLSPVLRGAAAVAEAFSGRAREAQTALLDGAIGAVWAPGGVPRVAFDVTVSGGKVVCIEVIAEPEMVGAIAVTILD